VTVACLPVAGKENPYQHLMMEGLREAGLTVHNGDPGKFFGILRTAMKRPDWIHFDWETNYYYRRALWMTLLNIPFFLLQVWAARLIFGCRLGWTPHNVQPHDRKHPAIHRFCRRFLARQVEWIRVFSMGSVARFSAELKIDQNIFIVQPEGSYVGYYPNAATQRESREHLSIPGDGPVVLYLGYIKPYKGIAELIEAFHATPPRTATLVIAGKVMDPDYFREISEKAGPDIKVIGQFIPDDELQYYMNAADLLVLPFRNIENSGSVILSMGFGKPIVAPARGVVAERLEEQPELLYVDDLTSTLHNALAMDRGHLQRIGKRNLDAVQRYHWSDFVKAFKQS